MTYRSIMQMGQSQGLMARIAACAAEQGNSDPAVWAGNNVLHLASTADWVTAWDYVAAQGPGNYNPDPGARDDVINDSMVLSAVQALKATQNATSGWPA